MSTEAKKLISNYRVREHILAAIEQLRDNLRSAPTGPFEEDPAVVIEKTIAKLSMPELLAGVERIYDEEFLQDELVEINKFCDTPAGRKAVKNQTTIMSRVNDMVIEMLNRS